MFGRDNNVLYYLYQEVGTDGLICSLTTHNLEKTHSQIKSHKSEHATNTTVVMRELDGFQIKDFNDELKMAVQNKNDYGFYYVIIDQVGFLFTLK